jgi:hypothetical protein
VRLETLGRHILINGITGNCEIRTLRSQKPVTGNRTSRDLACHVMFLAMLGQVNLSFPRLVMLHFPPYAPPQGHVKASSQYRDCTCGRTSFSLSNGLDACVPEAAARIRSLVDVVGYIFRVRRLDILLVSGRWSSFPNSRLVAAMDFPDGRVAILYTRRMVFLLQPVCFWVGRRHPNV